MQALTSQPGGETQQTQGAQADFAELSEMPPSIQGRYEIGIPSNAGSALYRKAEGPRRISSSRTLIKQGGSIQIVGQPVPGAHLVPDAAFRNQNDTINQILDLQKQIDRNNSGVSILDSIEKIHHLQQISLNQRELARNSTIDNIHTPVPGLGSYNKIVLQKQPVNEPMSKKQSRKQIDTRSAEKQHSVDNHENSSVEDFETYDNRIQPMTWSPENENGQHQVKPKHKFNKPENDPLIMNVLNLINQTEQDTPHASSPLSHSVEHRRGGFSPRKHQDNINKIGASLKNKKYRYRNKNDQNAIETDKQNIEIRNENNEDIQEMKKKLKDIITSGSEIPHLDRIRNQYASYNTYDTNNPQRHGQIGMFGVSQSENQVKSQIYQAYSRAKKNDSTNLNLSKIQDTQNVFSARRGTFGGFGNLDILNSNNLKMKHSPSVSPRANDNRPLNYNKPHTFLDKLEANKRTIRFDTGALSEPRQDSSRLPNIRAGSLLQQQKNSYLPDVVQSSLLKDKKKKRTPLMLSDTNSKESKDLEHFIQSIKNHNLNTQYTVNSIEERNDNEDKDPHSNSFQRRRDTNKRDRRMNPHPTAELTEETGEYENSDGEPIDGPIKLLDESTELAVFQRAEIQQYRQQLELKAQQEILDPVLLQKNVRRQIHQKQLEIRAQQEKKQIVSMPMGPLSQQIQQNVQDLQIMIQEKNIEDTYRQSPKDDYQSVPKMVRIVQKKRSSTKCEKVSSLASIYGQQQNIIKVPNQQYVTKNIKVSQFHTLNNQSELLEKRKQPQGKVSPLKKNKDYQNALKNPKNSLGLQKQREILQAQNMRLDNITLALLQGTPNT